MSSGARRRDDDHKDLASDKRHDSRHQRDTQNERYGGGGDEIVSEGRSQRNDNALTEKQYKAELKEIQATFRGVDDDIRRTISESRSDPRTRTFYEKTRRGTSGHEWKEKGVVVRSSGMPTWRLQAEVDAASLNAATLASKLEKAELELEEAKLHLERRLTVNKMQKKRS